MFYNYFLELRNRLLLITLSWVLAIIFCYLYKEVLLFLLIKINMNLYTMKSFYFISTNLTDVFNVYLQISYFVSTQLVAVSLIYHMCVFLSPALFKIEYEKIKIILVTSLLFYVISVVIFNLILLPWFWNFFLMFQYNSDLYSINVFFEAQIIEYFKFYINFYFTCVVIGQVFSCILLFLNFGHNRLNLIKKTRKFIYMIFLLIATLLTPPDVISQIITSGFLIVSYEMIVYFIIVKTCC